MRAATDTALITTVVAFWILSKSAFVAAEDSIWVPHIDEGPAPSPEDGPPLSFNALRDKKWLPAEIGGIVGAYVLTVLILGTLLLCVGRRLRRESQNNAEKALDVELVRQPPKLKTNIYPSPISPTKDSALSPGGQGHYRNFSWPSPEKSDRNPYIFPNQTNQNKSPISPASNPSVDFSVVAADKETMQRGLEDIYAHVMEQEEAKAAGISVHEMPPVAVPAPGPVPAASPQRNVLRSKNKPSNIDVDKSKKEKGQSRTASFLSSLRSPKKNNGSRQMQISSPIPTPLSSTFPASYASDEEPLSPRNYNAPPPPPPVPRDQVPYSSSYAYAHSRNGSRSTTTDPSPVSPSKSIAEQLESANLGTGANANRPRTSPNNGATPRSPLTANPPKQFPMGPYAPVQTSAQAPQQQHQVSHQPSTGALSISTTIAPSSPSHTPAPPSGQTQPPSASASTRTLPFRAFDPPSSGTNGIGSPTFSYSTKTTVLERTTPLSPGLRTPWSGGAVPYSPYQPFTPLMPVSPRLVTREDRRVMRRREPRSPVVEMVSDTEDMWGT